MFLDNHLPLMTSGSLPSNLSNHFAQEATIPKAMRAQGNLVLSLSSQTDGVFSSCGIQLKQSTGAMLELSSRELHHKKRGNRRGLQPIIIPPLVGCSMGSPGTWKSEQLTAVSAC